MSVTPLVQIPESALNSKGCVEELEKLLSRAKAGEVVGLLVIAETRSVGYDYIRVGVGMERAMGLHQRACYNICMAWDRGES